MNNQQDSEIRPPFINYGGHYNDHQHGQKRTFNSLAVHVCSVEYIYILEE